MDVNGGKLDFTATLDNSQIVAAIEETIKRVQGLSDGTASAGEIMQEAFDGMEDSVVNAVKNIQSAIDANTAKIQEHAAKIIDLGNEYAAAMSSGDTALANEKEQLVNALLKEQDALVKENAELEERKAVIAENTVKLRETREEMTKNSDAQATLRQRIKEVKDEMAALVLQSQQEGVQLDENTGRYAELRDELGQLSDVQADLAQQAKILSNDEARIAGVINGLSGLMGGFSAVTGAVSLFAGENENLQKVMTKLQSVMAITIGLQQVQQTLNKDSAFRLTTLANIKKWWGEVEAKANAQSAASTTVDTAAKNTNTSAVNKNTAALAKNKLQRESEKLALLQSKLATEQKTLADLKNARGIDALNAKITAKGNIERLNTAIGKQQIVVSNAQAVATTAAGTAATRTAGAFKLLGTAIKSIPGIGWILAGAGLLIGMITKVIGKIKETRAAIDEMNTKIAEGATEPVSKLQELQVQWNNLGDDLEKKKKFVNENKKAFQDLGVEVNNVKDAENILINNTDAFVNAQMARAKAMALNEKAQEKTKELLKAQADLETTPKQIERTVIHRSTGTYTSYMTDNPAYDRASTKVENLKSEIKNLYQQIVDENNKAAKELENAGIKAANNAATTTVTNTTKNVSETAEQTLSKQLAATKARYEQFYAWINSGDKDTQAAARTEFADLVQQGNNYLDYLKNQRTALIEAIGSNKATEEQAAQMRVLNEQIAQETKETVLSQFEAQLQSEIQGAQSLVDMLDIIKRKREELEDGEKPTVEMSEEDKERLKQLGVEMEEQFNGNVDLLHRKMIDAQNLIQKGWEEAGDGIATLYSSLYDEDIFENGVQTQLLITPILPNGDVLSPEELDDYVYNELSGAENILDADRLGLVIHVGDGAEDGFHLHELQEEYYDIVQFWQTVDADMRKKMQASLNEASSNATERVKTLLNQYRSFADQLVDIDKKYFDDAKALEFLIANAATEEEKARLTAALEERKKAYDKERKDIQDKELQTLIATSDAYQALFNNAQKMSKQMLKSILRDAEQLRDYVEGKTTELPVGVSKELADKLKKSPEDLKELYDQILELQMKINSESGYPFANLIQGFKNLSASSKAAKKAAEETDAAAKKAAQDQADALKASGISDIIKGANEAVGALGSLGQQLIELGENIDDSGIKNLGSQISGMSQIISSALTGFASGGEIGMAVSVGITLINGLAEALFNATSSADKTEKALEQFRRQVELLNITLNEDNYSNAFGIRRFAMLTDAIKYARQALDDYNAAVNASYEGEDWGWFQRGFMSMWSQLSEQDAIDRGLTALQGMQVATNDPNWAQRFFLGQDEEYKSLADVAPQLWNEDGSFNAENARAFLESYELLTDEQRDAIQNAIDLHDKYEENIKALREYIEEVFGYLADDAIESLTDAIIHGGDAWETWKQKGSKAIEAIGEQLMYELFLATEFDKLQKKLEGIYTSNADPVEAQKLATKALEEFFNQSEGMMNAAQQFGEDWKRLAAQHGFNIWSEEDGGATSFSGAVKTVSETTASIISGQMNAMRVNQVAANDMLRQQLLTLNAIKTDTAYLRSIDNRLRNIESAASGGAYQHRIIHQ